MGDFVFNPQVERLHDAAGRAYSGLPPSLPEHVRHRLEQEIIEGRLVPGERVTEDELATTIGVSRTPIREAMRVLEGQGLIVRRRGRGAFVAPRTTYDEAKALYELRLPLEAYLAARAVESITPAELETLDRLQGQFTKTLANQGETVDLRALMTLDSDFHWTLYNAANSDLASIVASYWGRLLRELYDRVYRSEHPSRFATQHDQIVRAIRHCDADAVRAAMEEHIRSGWHGIHLSYEQVGGARDVETGIA